MLAPVPSMELESEIIPNGNPDSDKKQHALGHAWKIYSRLLEAVVF
jgi:hypothetical protein